MTMVESDLAGKKCTACAAQTSRLSDPQIQRLVEKVPAWHVQEGQLTRAFKFKNYYETLAFVNATAWISHREDHHPDLAVGYNTCTVRYSTHAIGGLSENDFICAAKIDALLNM